MCSERITLGFETLFLQPNRGQEIIDYCFAPARKRIQYGTNKGCLRFELIFKGISRLRVFVVEFNFPTVIVLNHTVRVTVRADTILRLFSTTAS